MSQTAVREWCLEFKVIWFTALRIAMYTVRLNASKRWTTHPISAEFWWFHWPNVSATNFDWWIQFDYTLLNSFHYIGWTSVMKSLKCLFLLCLNGQFDQQNAHFRILKSCAFFYRRIAINRNALIVCVYVIAQFRLGNWC